MKRNQNGTYASTREVYKSVKKYDHAQFDRFCTNIFAQGYDDGYQKGYENGQKSVQDTVDSEVLVGEFKRIMQEAIEILMERIGKVKGIGAVRLGKVKDAIVEFCNDPDVRI